MPLRWNCVPPPLTLQASVAPPRAQVGGNTLSKRAGGGMKGQKLYTLCILSLYCRVNPIPYPSQLFPLPLVFHFPQSSGKTGKIINNLK